jgi:hypothetical protein
MLLLVIDNALNHPFLVDYCTKIQVVYLPLNTTPLLKSMDEGIVATFKRYYL